MGMLEWTESALCLTHSLSLVSWACEGETATEGVPGSDAWGWGAWGVRDGGRRSRRASPLGLYVRVVRLGLVA